MVNKTFSALTRRWIALWALVCSVVALPSVALALEPVIVDENTTEIKLGKHLKYFEDKEGTLTLEDVMKPEVAARFVKSEVDIPNFGLTSSAFWLALEVRNSTLKSHKKYIEVGYPLLDQLHVYWLDHNEVISHGGVSDPDRLSRLQHRQENPWANG